MIFNWFGFIKAKKQQKETISHTVVCDYCGWTGTAEESLKANPENDTCPSCGETALAYKLSNSGD